MHRAPGIPCALFIEGAKELKEFLQTSGAWRREIAETRLECTAWNPRGAPPNPTPQAGEGELQQLPDE